MKRRSCILSIFIAIVSYYQAKGQLFEQQSVLSSAGLTDGGIILVDLNNDNLLDLFVTGTNKEGHFKSKIFKNFGASFQEVSTDINPTTKSAIESADLNNDGLVDVIVSGTDSLANPTSRVYINKGNFSFDSDYFIIKSLHLGNIVCADLNIDGKKDLIICGVDVHGEYQCLVYENQSTYLKVRATLFDALRTGETLSLDYNIDGLPDIFINGEDNLQKKKSLVYKNEGNFAFSKAFELEGLAKGSANTGDLNIDGLLDLVISGEDNNNNYKTVLYLNQKNSFQPVDVFLPGFVKGTSFICDLTHDGIPEVILTGKDKTNKDQLNIYKGYISTFKLAEAYSGLKNPLTTLGDLSNDGNLDILQTGIPSENASPSIEYYRNLTPIKNSGPVKVNNPVVIPMLNKTFFTWDVPTDDATNWHACSYEVFVASEIQKENIKSTESSMGSGFRRIVSIGSVGNNYSYLIKSLPEGNYYWGVQSIDNSFVGGEFSLGNFGGHFPACDSIIFNTLNVYCQNTIKIGENRFGPYEVYSIKNGYLGRHLNTDLSVMPNDTIYIVHQGIKTCSEINAIITIDNPKGCFADYTFVDMQICKGQSIPMFDIPNLSIDLRLCVNGAQVLICPIDSSRMVHVNIVNSDGSIYVDSFYIEVLEPKINVTRTYEIRYGESVQLAASGAENYQWSPSYALNNPNIANPIASPTSTTLYFVNGTNRAGCVTRDSVLVIVKGDLFIPDLFSPNGDDSNDFFKVYGPGIGKVHFQIIDRNGIVVYESSDSHILNVGWDGKFKGYEQPQGAYLWSINGYFRDGRKVEFNGKKTGTLRLIR